MTTNQQSPIEPGRPVTIDFMQPENADGVVACFRMVYGGQYPIDTFNDPKRLQEANRQRHTISIIARNDHGQVVGHTALFRSAPHPGIYEAGAGLVVPEYRGTDRLLTRMVQFATRQGHRLGIDGLFGEMVCNHIISQKMGEGQGWIPSALEIDLMPAQAYDKQAEAGRVSALIGFRTFRPRPHTVYLPAEFENWLRALYDGLDDERWLKAAGDSWPDAVSSCIDLQVFEFAQVARLSVQSAGRDFASCLEKTLAEAKQKGVVVWQVWLNLGWPWVHLAADVVRHNGFFFGGLLPRWFDSDGLLLQKVDATPQWSEIQLAADRSRWLARMVQEDWKSASLPPSANS